MEALMCVICQESIRLANNELGESAQRISALVCGHVFHTFCIDKWLDQSVQKSCPKCRFMVKQKGKSTAFQLYLEVERQNLHFEDPSETPVVKELKKQVSLSENIIKREKERCAFLKSELESLKILHATSESRCETTERLLSVTKSRLKTDQHELHKCRDELKKLQLQVEALRATNTFVNGSVKDAEDIAANNLLDKSQLSFLCVTYKKDGQKLMKKLEEASDNLDKCERINHLLNGQLKKVTSELEELKSFVKNSRETFQMRSTDHPAGTDENSRPPAVIHLRSDPLNSRLNIPLNLKRPRPWNLGQPSHSQSRIPTLPTYDGLGGHTDNSLFRPKCKIVTSRTILKK